MKETAMSAPFVIITTHRIPPRGDEFEALTYEYLEHVRANEPRTQVHWAYVDDGRAEVALVQVHPDAHSADHHMLVSGELIGRGLSMVDTVGVEVYGEPGPVLGRALDANAASGVPVTIRAGSLGGLVRS
jgi:hypothetical protein